MMIGDWYFAGVEVQTYCTAVHTAELFALTYARRYRQPFKGPSVGQTNGGVYSESDMQDLWKRARARIE